MLNNADAGLPVGKFWRTSRKIAGIKSNSKYLGGKKPKRHDSPEQTHVDLGLERAGIIIFSVCRRRRKGMGRSWAETFIAVDDI